MAGISSLYKFPVYQTREEYGAGAPVYDPSRPIKSWRDPAPPPPDEDGNVQYLVLALAADKRTPAVKDGKPYLRLIRISAAEAAAVNIPPKDFSRDTRTIDPGALSPMASIDVPVPCRDLASDEELAFGFGGQVQVRKKGESPPASAGASDARLAKIIESLNTIEAKLDILLSTSRS